MPVLTCTPPRIRELAGERDQREKYLEKSRVKPLAIPSMIVYKDEEGDVEIQTKGLICIQIPGPFLEFYDHSYIYVWSPKTKEVKVKRNT